jgi:hypothetical protein
MYLFADHAPAAVRNQPCAEPVGVMILIRP